MLGLLRIEMLPVLGRIPAYSRLAVALVRAREVRPAHKVLLIGGVAYLVSPIDLIPGFVPVLGQLDDLSVALWALRRTLCALPAEVAERHLEANGLTWDLLEGDLGRVGRSGRLLLRTGLSAGRRVLTGAGRTLLRVGSRCWSGAGSHGGSLSDHFGFRVCRRTREGPGCAPCVGHCRSAG